MARVDRFERLRNRRTPMERAAKTLSESFSAAESSSEQELSYLIDSMQPIDEEFTRNTFAEADRVKEQLKNNLGSQYSAEFDYQGSVTNDTHIRIYSDIDLLTLDGRIVSLDAGAPNPYPYTRSVTDDLTAFRNDSARILRDKFPAATVDASPGKAISMKGGSLQRKIDVVVGNWWDTELYKQYRVKMARGVQIIDTKGPWLIRNKPFWHNYEIDKKDKATLGLRKVIRLLKTLKYDADPELSISSYDIAAIAWNMAESALTVKADAYVTLATNARDELKRFIDNNSVRDSLSVPNATRPVFTTGGATVEELRQLHRELSELIARASAEQLVSFTSYGSLGRRTASRRMPLWEERRPEVVAKNSY